MTTTSSRHKRGGGQNPAYRPAHRHLDLAHGLYVDPDGGRILFRDYAETWRVGQIHRTTTAAQAETYLRLHAYPRLGNRPLGAIRRSEIQAWVKDRSGELAPGSVEVVYRWVSTIFKAAVGDRLIASSPCIRMALPKRADTEVVPLSVGEVEALAAAVPIRYRALLVFAAGTGLRQGECFGLTVDRVDFLRRHLRVDRQLISARAGVPEFGPPKSKAGFRTVPMPEVVGSALAAHLARHGHGPAGLHQVRGINSQFRAGFWGVHVLQSVTVRTPPCPFDRARNGHAGTATGNGMRR